MADPGSPRMGVTVTDLQIDNTGAGQANVPVTFGQVFKQGDIAAGEGLAARLGDGTSLPVQLDAKATHADGSLRHAVISTVLPTLSAGSTRKILLVRTGATAAAPAAPPASLTGKGFTAGVEVNLGGQLYTASVEELLGHSVNSTTWLAGPVATEWLVWAPLKTAAGTPHPYLTARFAVRSYAGLSQAKVDVVLENVWAYPSGAPGPQNAAPQNLTYDVNVKVGGTSVYSKSGLRHAMQARWRKSFWWTAAPQVHIRHNTAYLIASKAVPNYDQTISVTPASVAWMKAKLSGAAAEPMGSGLANPYMPTTGGRPDIGLIPGWAVQYLLSMNKDAREATLLSGDLAGSWPAHYRDKNTGKPISIVDYPYMSVIDHNSGDTYNTAAGRQEAFPACSGDCAASPNVADVAHQPSLVYVPYLVTGDHYYLEELQFWAMFNLFRGVPAYRGFDKGLFKSEQVRGQAWGMRSVADAAYLTPDDDVLKKQFQAILNNNIGWYVNTYVTGTPPDNQLGIITNGYAVGYAHDTGIGPWQDDFVTAVAGSMVERGFTQAAPLLAWKAKFPVGRMVAPGFCWIQGSAYYLAVRPGATAPFFTTMAEVYQATAPATVKATACASTEMGVALGLPKGAMEGGVDASGAPAIMQPALAYSVDAGVASAASAWSVFMGRTAKPDYTTSPQFAIVPR